MTILNYSLKKDGERRLAASFLAKEFACHDGSDAFKVDEKLLNLLQKIRDHFHAAVVIHSAFRTVEHNRKIGGSSNSQHLYGIAADFHVVGMPHLKVAQCAESLNAGGIGLYSWGVHVDMRSVKSRWQEEHNALLPITTFGGQEKSLPQVCAIKVEQKTLYVNNMPKTVRAGLLDNENYVHLRDIADALDAVVSYDNAAKKVLLTK